ncbi:MAG: hypothetical protein ACLQEQ_07525 [Nitrososphaerales archaeon]
MKSHGWDSIPRPPAYKSFETVAVAAESRQAATVDWGKFSDWLCPQYSHKHTTCMLSNAKRYHEAMLDTGKAAQLRILSPDCRRLAMMSLAALSKFMGVYEGWQQVRRQAGLKWQGKRAISVVHALLDQEATTAMGWLHAVLPKLSYDRRVPLVFAALTGLRPSEACNSCALIYKLSKEGKLAEYYDSELSMLQHYKYPQLFLRNTKNAFITFVSPRLVELAGSTPPPPIWACVRRYRGRACRCRSRTCASTTRRCSARAWSAR